MTSTKTIAELNRELGDQVLEDAKRHPQKYSGKYVGIANGKMVCCDNSLKTVCDRLDESEPDPSRTFVVDTTRDLNKVLRISETWYAIRPMVPDERPSYNSNHVGQCEGTKIGTDGSS